MQWIHEVGNFFAQSVGASTEKEISDLLHPHPHLSCSLNLTAVIKIVVRVFSCDVVCGTYPPVGTYDQLSPCVVAPTTK